MLLETIGIFVVAAATVGLLLRRLKLPSIISYIAAGLVVGPVTGLVRLAEMPATAVDTAGELGIVLLMFLVGLELSLDRIKQVGKVAFAAGIGQVVFTAAGGLVIALALGFTFMESLFLATALTFSSTVVVVKLLDQKGHLHALYGQIAVGIFLVQDLVVIVILTLLAGLGDADAPTDHSVGWGLLKAFGGMALLLVGSALAARHLLPRPLAWSARNPRTLVMWSLTLCLGFVLAAHALSLSAEIGAFLAGLSVAQLPCAHVLRVRLHPLMSFFVAIFFVSLGARMDLAAATDYAWESVALSLFVLIGNPFVFMLIIPRFGYSERTCFQTSVTVAQISEFSLIFATMGVAAGLIGAHILAITAVVGLVTIAASAYLILYSEPIYDWLAPKGFLKMFRARAGQEPDSATPPLRDHVVVVGMNDLGRRLVLALAERGETVLAIDTDPRKLAGLPARPMVGDIDFETTAHEAGLADARLAISTLRIASANKLFAYRCRRAGVPVAVYGFDRSVYQELHATGPDLLYESRGAAGRALARALVDRGLLPADALVTHDPDAEPAGPAVEEVPLPLPAGAS